jgi:hypothetical protein
MTTPRSSLICLAIAAIVGIAGGGIAWYSWFSQAHTQTTGVTTEALPTIDGNDVSLQQLRALVGQRVKLNAVASRTKPGVFVFGSDYKIELPRESLDHVQEHTAPIEVAGVLSFIAESYWYQDPNENLKPDEGPVQSASSHQVPAQFKLVP